MNRFNAKGMLVIPNPLTTEKICKHKKILVVKECYCPNGHNIISQKAIFNGFPGIVFKVCRKEEEGLVALSPVYGYKSRVAMNVDLIEGQIWDICCPVCNVSFPIYAQCSCGGQLIALFTNKDEDFSNCVGICNRIDCYNAGIKYGNELLSMSMVDAL